MKTIKINFVGQPESFEPEWSFVYQVLRKFYDVQITENPDYIICDSFGSIDSLQAPYLYCDYPQVRIMENGENYIPDFNLVDYAVSRCPIYIQDRSFYLPGCIGEKNRWMSLPQKNRDYDMDFVKSKEFFCNFIAGHESEDNIRGDFFKKLSEYKRVESPGSYLNNMPDGKCVQWNNSSKTDFQRKCKFTLCFESTSQYGFITEKITDAFYSDTIPVYYGSTTVTDIFNDKAFINCANYDSLDEVIERIKELDQDDEKYLDMLRQPILVDSEIPERIWRELERFVCHIFDQPLEKAYRRSRVYMPKTHNDFLVWAVKKHDNNLKAWLKRFVQSTKK